jgi:hypothetical protein
MSIQTKISTETTINFRKQQYCFGVDEHQNHNLKAGNEVCEDTKHLRKKKKKIWYDEIKLIVQQKNFTQKKYLQTKTTEYEIQYKHRRVIAKREITSSQIIRTIYIAL